MQPGRMRDRIEILTRVSNRGALGNAETWTVSYVRWGRMSVKSITARANFQQALNSEVTHTALFRGRLEFSLSDNRIRWRGKEFEIVGKNNDVAGLGNETLVDCKVLDNGR